jgi:ribosomal protein L29
MAKVLRAELQTQLEEVRAQYETGSRALQEKLKVGQPAGQASMEHVLKEIARVEADASRCASDLERMVADDSVAIGRLLQIRNQELELKAYLRGLNFQAGVDPQNPPKS